MHRATHCLPAVQKRAQHARVFEGHIRNRHLVGATHRHCPVRGATIPCCSPKTRATRARLRRAHWQLALGWAHFIDIVLCTVRPSPRSSMKTRATRVFVEGTFAISTWWGQLIGTIWYAARPPPSFHFGNARDPRAFLEGTFEIGPGLQSKNARDPRTFSKRTFAIGSWRGTSSTLSCDPVDPYVQRAVR